MAENVNKAAFFALASSTANALVVHGLIEHLLSKNLLDQPTLKDIVSSAIDGANASLMADPHNQGGAALSGISEKFLRELYGSFGIFDEAQH